MCSCSLKDDFLRALEALMEQRQRFDYILVETTGKEMSPKARNAALGVALIW
jgi:G3E family GTPase